MNELVQLVAQKTGLAEDKAHTAVVTVLSFLKDRLPSPLAGQLDSFLVTSGNKAQDVGAGLGDLLNRK